MLQLSATEASSGRPMPHLVLVSALLLALLAIVGGAVVPVIIGGIGDHVGLRAGLAFLYVTFGFVLSVGFWAKPLISNATIAFKKASAEAAV